MRLAEDLLEQLGVLTELFQFEQAPGQGIEPAGRPRAKSWRMLALLGGRGLPSVAHDTGGPSAAAWLGGQQGVEIEQPHQPVTHRQPGWSASSLSMGSPSPWSRAARSWPGPPGRRRCRPRPRRRPAPPVPPSQCGQVEQGHDLATQVEHAGNRPRRAQGPRHGGQRRGSRRRHDLAHRLTCSALHSSPSGSSTARTGVIRASRPVRRGRRGLRGPSR